uniref:RlpA-like protein double-psi beta-barrel domain-containing protein n=1 Tax=Leersia perrieri TaxID=77586 RepID=A0A0D9VIQ6_9ORYZ
MTTTTTNRLLAALAITGLVLVSFPRLSRGDGRELAEECRPSGTLTPTRSYSCQDCCEKGQAYPTYTCSPPTTARTKAVMTLNDFEPGGDGGGPSECDDDYHQNTELVVALSTGWYANGERCGKNIQISANGKQTVAKVVDECDSQRGCDEEHAFQPPCRNNIVDASQAVWDSLGITGEEVGEIDITWSDA